MRGLGSEVVTTGLEVVHPQDHPVDFQPTSNYQTESGYPSAYPIPTESQKTAKPRVCGLRRIVFFLTITVALLVIAIIVLGAVLGTRKHSSAVVAPAGSASPSPTPHSILPLSSLAVTGTRIGSDYTISLFYQDQRNYIQLGKFESVAGGWTEFRNLTRAKAGSPLAPTVIRWDSGELQTELFYLDDSNTIREWNDATVNAPTGDGSLSAKAWKAGASSRLAAYWPSIFYQDDSDTLQRIGWGSSGFSQDSRDHLGTVNVFKHAGLATVPRNQNYTGVEVFYQRNDGRLAEYWSGLSDSGEPSGWNFGAILDEIPPSAPIAAFSTPRGNDRDSNIYILWQSSNTTDIQVKWIDDGSGWKGPSTFPALKGADNGTSIACLTPRSNINVSLAVNSDLSRCYFQAGGNVKEVFYTGREWKVMGNVPIR